MESPADILQSALAAHRRGEFDEAERLYRRVLDLAPDHSDGLHLLGVVRHQRGDSAGAVEFIRRAIAIRPDPRCFNNLGNALRKLERLDEAAEAFEQAIRLDPDYAGAHHNLGLVHRDAGRDAEAEECFTAACDRDPALVDAWTSLAERLLEQKRHDEAADRLESVIREVPRDPRPRRLLARVLSDRGRLEEADEELNRVLALVPNDVDALNDRGLVLLRLEDREGARKAFRAALAVDEDSVEGLNNLADLYRREEKFDRAIVLLRRAAELAPDSPTVLANLGIALHETRRTEEAIETLNRAVAADEEFLVAWIALGNAHRSQERFEEALACYRHAEAIDPESPEAFYNRSKTLLDLRRIAEALDASDRCVELAPNFANGYVNRFFAKCLLGRIEDAWPDFDWRFDQPRPPRRVPGPDWDGSSLRGRRVLVYGEQGLGDEVMFASCIPDVVAEADAVVLECCQRLVPLFQRSFPSTTVVARPYDADDEGRGLIAPGDPRIPMGTLPRFLRATPEAFPRAASFLRADPAAVEEWRERFRALGAGPTIGIAWFGGLDREVRRLRSTDLVEWKAILTTPGVRFLNLQYGDCTDELRQVRDQLGVDVHHFAEGNPMTDLDAFAAKVAAVDLVVSVDNSTVHLAGALGAPTWAMIPRNSDWRWFDREHDTLWYRSVRLFRQPTRCVWKPVFERVRGELTTFVEQHRDDASRRFRLDPSQDLAVPAAGVPRGTSLIRPATAPR